MMKSEQYKDLYNNAIKLVTNQFLDKKDKAGKPYLDHLYAVAGNFTKDNKLFIVALLHDVIEDTDTTKEDIEREFGAEIAELVDLLTHKENEPYESYIERISTNYEASEVKKADLRHNMSIWRLKEFTDKDIDRLKKYHKAYIYLETKWL